MYCSSCGSIADKGLKYCKNCGTKVAKDRGSDSAGGMLDNILTTIFLVVMFGLGILVGLVAVLLDKNIEPKFVVFIAVAYLAAVFGICYTLLAQVPKLIDAKLKTHSGDQQFVPPELLHPRNTAQLEEFHEPASVTENTTRILDKVPAPKL